MGSTCAVSISEKLQVLQASGKPPETEPPAQTLQLRQLHEACRRGDLADARRSLAEASDCTGAACQIPAGGQWRQNALSHVHSGRILF
eukprot:s6036_g3.t1